MTKAPKKQKLSRADRGDVVSVDQQGFTTSTGLSFDFPFPVEDVSVEDMNSYWYGWCNLIDGMIEEDTSKTPPNRNG